MTRCNKTETSFNRSGTHSSTTDTNHSATRFSPGSIASARPALLAKSTDCTMGGRCGIKGARKGHNAKNKQYKRKIWLSRRDKDIDQIDEDMKKAEETQGLPEVTFDYDVDLPGGGQFYCSETGKHFIDAKALEDHKKTKFYKRRVKELKAGNLHNMETSEWAAGMTKEVLPPAHAKA